MFQKLILKTKSDLFFCLLLYKSCIPNFNEQCKYIRLLFKN